MAGVIGAREDDGAVSGGDAPGCGVVEAETDGATCEVGATSKFVVLNAMARFFFYDSLWLDCLYDLRNTPLRIFH